MPNASTSDRKTEPQHGPLEATVSGSETLTLSVETLADVIEARYGDPKRFMLQVKAWLGENRLTQITLAEEAGVDGAALNRWLNHHIQPSLKNMLLLDEALERLLADREGS